MHVGVLHIELHIPQATSLKARRQVLQSIKMGVRAKFNVSAAEVAHQDLWQRAGLGFACAGADRAVVDATLQRVFALIDARTDCEITAHGFEFL